MTRMDYRIPGNPRLITDMPDDVDPVAEAETVASKALVANTILTALEGYAERYAQATHMFEAHEPGGRQDKLIVYHCSHVTWDFQPDEIKEGDFAYRIQWGGDGPSDEVWGRETVLRIIAAEVARPHGGRS